MLDLGTVRDLLRKVAAKKVHFREKDLPGGPRAERKAKEVYSAIKRRPAEMKRRYGKRWKEVAARTALKETKHLR